MIKMNVWVFTVHLKMTAALQDRKLTFPAHNWCHMTEYLKVKCTVYDTNTCTCTVYKEVYIIVTVLKCAAR